MPKKNTSWEGVAGWYDKLLEGEGTYQKELILPNLFRLMGLKPGDRVLDLACGQGFFSREAVKKGASVLGVDAARTLVDFAIQHSPKEASFRVGPAHKLNFLKDESFDKAMIVLAIQNIENPQEVFAECSRILKKSGKLFLVLNHPAFRVPKASSWGWDEEGGVQYRRIDKYLSEAKVPIDMHPGEKNKKETVSFHRPLQYYVKALAKAGFALTVLEEWNSHKKSEPGPRARAEDAARKEIPLFMCLGAKKGL
jgi:ubiquinone/menaquinone biosynthesis C-methylase UbiE